LICPHLKHPPAEIKYEMFHRLGYCQEFLLGGAVVLLSGGEILDLRQYSSYIVVTSFCVQNVLFSGIGVSQDWCSA